MSGLIRQLRVSLLVVLVLMVPDLLLREIPRGLWSGNVLADLGGWALSAVVVCALVAAVHAAIYGAAHTGRPGAGEARAVRAGLLILHVFDLLLGWPLWTKGTWHVVVALVPLLVTVVTWVWSRSRGETAEIARNRALLFGILAVPLQLVGVAVLVA
ncbi:hypothetical protein OG562_22290 [Streptomyces sp. NBC_01275]|uniref:hypothetical protein n=1 Tax=Streptomyces sp. NBC_01275 TaxID=2903807 RepID=UPI00225A125F|nr:hypothetical protein [Streptomyces sp. NBC_01275]MCX4763642.1 hypothetical protein [Streptomyces sp. NBC_01275]